MNSANPSRTTTKNPKIYRALTTFLVLPGLSTLAGAQTQALIDFGNQSAGEISGNIAGNLFDSGVVDPTPQNELGKILNL